MAATPPFEAVEKLVANTEPRYELIIVDNDSPDDTADRLTAGLAGADLVRNDENVGFAEGCNQGAARAAGTYLCFLNPDAFVEPGWLEPLLDVFARDAAAGAAVPLFLHPDGRVQEAGSAVDSDGSAPWRSGTVTTRSCSSTGSPVRSTTARQPASSCEPTSSQEVGGFDPAYSPAYYEDVDLCFKLAERGSRPSSSPSPASCTCAAGRARGQTRSCA